MLSPVRIDPRVSSADVPILLVRLHVALRRIREVEQALGRLPLHDLATRDGADVSNIVVDAVIELERIRTLLLSSGTEPA